MAKNMSANAGDLRHAGLILDLGGSPGGKPWQPTSVYLSRASHGQRSLVG